MIRLESKSMRHFASKHSGIGILTFVIGVLAAGQIHIPVALLSLLLILVTVVIVIVGMILCRGAISKYEWRPLLGKGLLAIFFWSIPSAPVLIFNLLYQLEGSLLILTGYHTIGMRIFILAFTVLYALAGYGLCFYLSLDDAVEHWLVRSNHL